MRKQTISSVLFSIFSASSFRLFSPPVGRSPREINLAINGDHGTLTSEPCRGVATPRKRWTGMKRVKPRGLPAYFIIGQMAINSTSTWTVAVQPNRKITSDLRILVLNETGVKVGYVLLSKSNALQIEADGKVSMTRKEQASSLMGAFLDPQYRNGGHAKRLLQIWLHLCDQINIPVQTEVIRKPLLNLVLEHSLGFVSAGDGVALQVFPGHNASITKVYSSRHRSLMGVFSPWTVTSDHLEICSVRPEGEGRTVHVNGRLVRIPHNCSMATLPRDFRCDISDDVLRTVLLGE